MSNLKEQRPREDEIRPHINPPWGIFLASRENVATLDQEPISNILQSIFLRDYVWTPDSSLSYPGSKKDYI